MNISCTVLAKFGVAFGRTNSHTTTHEKKTEIRKYTTKNHLKTVKNAVDVSVLVFWGIKKFGKKFLCLPHGGAR